MALEALVGKPGQGGEVGEQRPGKRLLPRVLKTPVPLHLLWAVSGPGRHSSLGLSSDPATYKPWDAGPVHPSGPQPPHLQDSETRMTYLQRAVWRIKETVQVKTP